MNFLKKWIIPLLCVSFLSFLLFNMKPISLYLTGILEKKPTYDTNEKSIYQNQDTFQFVQNTDDFTPLSKKDIKNIFYTIVNNGWNNFTFFCPNEYEDCLDDVASFSSDADLPTHINNFVHPYNSFSSVKTTSSESGEINMSIEYLYSKEMIEKINTKVDTILKEVTTNDMESQEKIKAIHDYIINNTKYDVKRNEAGTSDYQSYLAYGPLFEGFATCVGYTDAMAIFLSKLNIPNYKIATTPESNNKDSAGHVWNALKLEDKWLHLDLTWDDPVSDNGKDYLLHKYFLVNNEALKKADEGEVIVTEHNFKSNIYLEFKN